MTTYNVHIYREMRLVFGGIEADSHEAAASIARDRLTSDADDIDDCEGETYSALVDVQGDEEYEHSRVIDFEPQRERQAAPKLLAALTWLLDDLADVEEDRNPETGAEYDSVTFARAARDEAKAAGVASPPPVGAPVSGAYSVLLLYPDYANDGGTESYYAFVEAQDAIEAVAVAQRQAAAANDCTDIEPADFAPLLVTEGHHYGQPLFNK